MIANAAVFLLFVAVIFGLFSVLALIAESLDRRDARRVRATARLWWRAEWLLDDVTRQDVLDAVVPLVARRVRVLRGLPPTP